MTTSMIHSRSMLAKVIAESPSPFIITIFETNVINILILVINYFMEESLGLTKRWFGSEKFSFS
ncbi:hypothetical protein DTK66_06460 [Lactobacillus sp. M31]|uniref:Uncharacterized protein n=1 Tax=Limosilactobacillus walteri TaxID=2268022 RepID=A0ABR8P7P3_9LACO|nr:hypothetical protein [Limosilactobacillus walteri]